MTREEAKELMPIIQAWLEGKQIQYRDNEGWKDLRKDFCPIGYAEVRIKSEPKYRPFKTQEECWNEMLKHQPFGWIRNTDTQSLHNINSVYNNSYSVGFNNRVMYFDTAFNVCNFVDGTPFGVKEK